MENLGGAEQRLGRDAAPVETDAAEIIALDDGGLEAELRGADGADIAARARADDDDVEIRLSHSNPSPLLGPSIIWVAARDVIARFLVGDWAKNSVLAEPFEHAGTDIEIATVERKLAGFDGAPNPGKGHQVGERQADRFMLAEMLPFVRGHRGSARPRRFGDADPLADEIRHFGRRAVKQRANSAAHGVA